MCSSVSGGAGLRIPHCILDCFSDGCTELVADSFILLKEACLECVFYRRINLLADDREELIGVIVEYFADDQLLYLGADWPAKCINLGLSKLTGICIVLVDFVGLVVIDVGLALEWVPA